jgi:hypothetical protein
MKKAFFSLILLSGLIISCNNSAKEEKTEVKDTTVMPTPAPTPPDSTNGGDTTGKGEQAPPPKTN